jgi:CxxC-x17-CxxC domain-containing protein
MFEDRTLQCKDCGADFLFTAGEQEFYVEKGLTNEPKRCKNCRDAKKNVAKARGRFTAVCSKCGGIAILPFEPYNERRVYCTQCVDKLDAYREKREKNDIVTVTESNIHFYQPGMVGHIKDNKSQIYRKYLKPNTNEDLIIGKLSQLLYVTKIDNHSMDGHVYYPFCLLGSTEFLKRYVRGQREFLLIFSHFDTEDWQAKTLKIEYEIRKRKTLLGRNIIPNFYLLVSNAANFKYEIDSIKGEPRAAIIPFSFSEILRCDDKDKFEKLLLERFHEYHFENNLLAENKAIEDDNLLFGDRGKIADAVVERCRKGNHSGIFGLRRSGKTSVLNATLRRLEREY